MSRWRYATHQSGPMEGTVRAHMCESGDKGKHGVHLLRLCTYRRTACRWCMQRFMRIAAALLNLKEGLPSCKAQLAANLCAALNMLKPAFYCSFNGLSPFLSPCGLHQAAPHARIIPWLRRQVHACSTLLAHTRGTAHCGRTSYKTLLPTSNNRVYRLALNDVISADPSTLRGPLPAILHSLLSPILPSWQFQPSQEGTKRH